MAADKIIERGHVRFATIPKPRLRRGRGLWLGLAGSLLAAAAALGQATPFAEPPLRASETRLSLGNLMSLVQQRHIKL